ncbi:endonuclease domain-containing protein [Candidatus Uhrbacteria bacterium]|nr:endonuclease domain-containing protein [Candidatus Uhrbacteria bacterium]
MQKLFNSGVMKFRRKELRNNATPTERLLWSYLRGSALGCKFRRQTSIGSFVVDFYCPVGKLVIEIDGSVHEGEKAGIYDAHRQRVIEQAGLRVIRFTTDEITGNMEAVLRTIRASLENPLLTKERAG